MSDEQHELTLAAKNAEIRLEHKRELLKVEDARITALETQATAVIPAAIAIAAFYFAATNATTTREDISVIGLGAIALATSLMHASTLPGS